MTERRDPPPPVRSSTDELIDQLRAEGEADSEGNFGIDTAVALSRIGRYLLPDPRYYVLELVQAAVLRGAASIRFDFQETGATVTFDGTPFADAELARLPESLLFKPRSLLDEGLRQLALAVYSALELEPTAIYVTSGTTRLRVGKPEEPASQPSLNRTSLPVPARRTTIELVNEGILANLKWLLSRSDVPSFVVELLAQRCAYARPQILVHGRQISSERSEPSAILARSFTVGTWEGTLCLLPTSAVHQVTTVRLMRNGVHIEDVHAPQLLPGFVVRIEDPALPLDISHQRVVLSEVLGPLRRHVLAQQLATLAAMCRDGIPSASFADEERHLRTLLWDLLRKLADCGGLPLLLGWAYYPWASLPALTGDALADWPRVVQDGVLLIDTPVLRGTQDEPLTLRQLLDELRFRGELAYSHLQGDKRPPELAFILYLADRQAVDVLGRLLAGVGRLQYRAPTGWPPQRPESNR